MGPLPPSSCPFCNIATTYPPIPPTTFLRQQDQSKNAHPHPHHLNIVAPRQPLSPDSFIGEEQDASPTPTPTPTPTPQARARAHLILSTRDVLAFLDIMPLTRGHVLVAPRGHFEKLGDVGVVSGREIGQWLPIISRVVMRTLFGEESKEFNSDWNWNVVQNNGARAAQQVPHVHFHIIPRPPDRPASGPGQSSKSYVMFGRGQRDELDDEEGESLARLLREELAREIIRVRREEDIDLERGFDSVDRKWKVTGKL
ncbi:HIT-like protein [Aspergillus heteromorphus CBS 117.55]|uniref:HIT-like protein n=1 Tax=Aspergillus heteromorphus CBS 117.55 TaxID=1448321 RepID=A0A317W3V4_9EURO|nr:HIT-like protein [Aspergillus heteromorphus CBS 117.55]PWY80619.1 HIT-like protein [Aspergillus heteromorphus CBS 117.55]